MKFLSSIFSFETLKAIDLPGHWRASIGLLVVLLVGAELAARVLMAPVGDHLWAYSPTESSASFEWYRHLATNGQTPGVVAIGDSTGVRNFDPETFAARSEFDTVYSLARAGNFPLALRSNTLPLLKVGDPPNVVLLLQSANSFRDDPRVDQIERGALSPVLEARREGRRLATDYLYLTRLFPARSLLRRHWIHRQPLLIPSGFGSFSPFHRSGKEITNIAAARKPDIEDVEFSDERRDVILELVEIAQEREFLLLAVIGPQRDYSEDTVTKVHLQWLMKLEAAACGYIAVMDLRNAPYIESADYKDNNHLYSAGATKFSAHLAAVIEAEVPHLRAERSRNTCPQDAERLRQTLLQDE